VLAFALVAFLAGAIVGAQHGSSGASTLALDFVKAWIRGDYPQMYADLTPASRRVVSLADFADAYRAAQSTVTAERASLAGHARALSTGEVTVPVVVRTHMFGTLRQSFRLRVEGGSQEGVAWNRSLVFPGLHVGERLTRNASLPPRAALLARDGSTLASGEVSSGSGTGERPSPLGVAADAVVGTVGPIPSSERAALEAQGVPSDSTVGTSGLELAFDDKLRGRPGGELLAGQRVLASVKAVLSPPVRTTISPQLQRTAVVAMGSHLGGVVALVPHTGEILAVAGLALDALQPPGSTFKMVTVTGVLEAGIAHPDSRFPYRTYATLDGVKLANANGEECGGSLELAFAVSCNSVFAPLGVKLGAQRLVAVAERFGFNQGQPITGAAASTLPAASAIQGELDLGSSAIGQGQVQASTLQMALVATTIADHGERPTPTFGPGSSTTPMRRVTTPVVAAQVRKMMIAVVREGTGTAAAIPGVTVAGKTGTAELGSPRSCQHNGEASETGSASENETSSTSESAQGCSGSAATNNTDAWFAAFAPALDPKIAVGVMLVKDGAGGDTAAPIAHEVLESALQAHL
jgi:cell division protein FtsI/penicillin-binding protein 2